MPYPLLLRTVLLRTAGDELSTRMPDEKLVPAYSTVTWSSTLEASSAPASKRIPPHCPAAGVAALLVNRIGPAAVPCAMRAPRLAPLATWKYANELNFSCDPAPMLRVTR